jgi:hypothetical protein
MKHNEYKKLLQLSLYGELDSVEQALLKEHIISCEECRHEFEDQKNLMEIISIRRTKEVDDKILSAARYQLRGALKAETEKKNILQTAADNILQFFTTPIRFTAAGFAILLAGILIGSFFFGRTHTIINDKTTDEVQYASLTDDIKITNLRFIDSDPSDGQVEFTFEASRPVHMRGKVTDPKIQGLLTYAMLNEQNPGSRLNSINAMDTETPMLYDSDVKNALITVVMTDENSGVRREALKLMSKLPYDESLKQTYLYVITNDSISGLRIAAMNSLIEAGSQGYKLSKDELNLFKQKLQQDENNYIQLRAKTIIQEYN